MAQIALVERQRARLRITDDWYVDEISTLEECSQAHAELTVQIVGIHLRLEDPIMSPDEEWAHRARAALRFKQAALVAVQNKRGEINSSLKAQQHERDVAFRREVNALVVAAFHRLHPEDFRRTMAAVEAEARE